MLCGKGVEAWFVVIIYRWKISQGTVKKKHRLNRYESEEKEEKKWNQLFVFLFVCFHIHWVMFSFLFSVGVFRSSVQDVHILSNIIPSSFFFSFERRQHSGSSNYSICLQLFRYVDTVYSICSKAYWRRRGFYHQTFFFCTDWMLLRFRAFLKVLLKRPDKILF